MICLGTSKNRAFVHEHDRELPAIRIWVLRKIQQHITPPFVFYTNQLPLVCPSSDVKPLPLEFVLLPRLTEFLRPSFFCVRRKST